MIDIQYASDSRDAELLLGQGQVELLDHEELQRTLGQGQGSWGHGVVLRGQQGALALFQPVRDYFNIFTKGSVCCYVPDDDQLCSEGSEFPVLNIFFSILFSVLLLKAKKLM